MPRCKASETASLSCTSPSEGRVLRRCDSLGSFFSVFCVTNGTCHDEDLLAQSTATWDALYRNDFSGV